MFWTVLLAILALLWVVQGVRLVVGTRSLPRLGEAAPLGDADCPSISILFSARDEAEKLPTALATLLAVDYPRLEIVAVNDRSTDGTGRILEEAAARDPRPKVVHVAKLPPGWLGKPHGLLRAYEASGGEWLIFTDADVRFAPDLLRRAAAVARERGWDHLTVFGHVDSEGFWERVLVSHFFFGGALMLEAWRVSNPRSRRYAGAGMFQFVRRAAYEAGGTHRRLALEVLDDMKLGKIVKQAGHRSGVIATDDRVAVRWHDGAGAGRIIRNLEKNMFAAVYFSAWLALLGCVSIAAVLWGPLVALFVLPAASWGWMCAAVASLVPALLQARTCREQSISGLYGLTYPLGTALMIFAVINSTVKTLRRGGIVWRDTFYPLRELRKGLV